MSSLRALTLFLSVFWVFVSVGAELLLLGWTDSTAHYGAIFSFQRGVVCDRFG